MFRKIIAPLLLILGLISALPAFSQEQQTRIKMNIDVSRLFLASDFDTLEKMAEDYRSTDARSPSGLQMLNLFYASFHQAVRTELRRNGNTIEPLALRSDAWFAAYPESPTSAITTAIILSQHALQFAELHPEQFTESTINGSYLEWLYKADTFLLETKDFVAIDPYWYTQRADVLNRISAPDDVYHPNLREGLDRHPTFYQLYFAAFNRMRSTLESHAPHLEFFANFAVSNSRLRDSDGLYARMYWYAAQAHYGDRLFEDTSISWDKMRDGIYDVLEDYPDQWNIQHFARFACLAGDAETTRQLMSQMTVIPIPGAWPGNSLLNCRLWAQVN
ncbi:hypothetical protein [Thalassobius sp. I31.1]|uniref:hypothetical protein n=1 Tax=Thalassobius sp. I31.1 TaxID=2109912 RepID=UPI000D1A9D6B|nr:hypothetical protein [Thalassobius sp. I31.1]